MPTTQLDSHSEDRDGPTGGYDETVVASSCVSPSIVGRWIRNALGSDESAAPPATANEETIVGSSRVSPSVMGRWIREAVGSTDAPAPHAAPLADFGAVDECSFAASEHDAPEAPAALPRLWNENAADESTVAYDFSADAPREETKLLESPADRTKMLDWNAAAAAAPVARFAPTPEPAPVAHETVTNARAAAVTYRKALKRNARALRFWAQMAVAAAVVGAVAAALVLALG